MKILSLLMWVVQFGLSILVPPCFLLLVANWLQTKFGWGIWTTAVFGILGILIAVSTARANWRAMRRAAEEAASQEPPPVSFNDHK